MNEIQWAGLVILVVSVIILAADFLSTSRDGERRG